MTRTAHDGIERRLRQALDARAAGITVRELRPADPPGPHVRRFPLLRLRGLGLPLAGLAAAAAAVVGYLVLAPDPAPVRPVPPAAPPELPTPGPAPESESPRPSPPSSASVSPSARPVPGGVRPPSAPSASPSAVPPATPRR